MVHCLRRLTAAFLFVTKSDPTWQAMSPTCRPSVCTPETLYTHQYLARYLFIKFTNILFRQKLQKETKIKAGQVVTRCPPRWFYFFFFWFVSYRHDWQPVFILYMSNCDCPDYFPLQKKTYSISRKKKLISIQKYLMTADCNL